MLAETFDPTHLIPRLDYGLPAPRGLLRLLYDAAFLLHIVFMNFALIAPLLIFVNELAAAAGCGLPAAVNRRLRTALPIAISFTITTGIGPLLLVQLLYGRFFYTSNILVAPYWLSILGTLLITFYLVYLTEWARKRPRLRVLVWLLAALTFAGVVSIGYIHTNNSLLSMTPGHWDDFRTGRLTLHVVDRMTLPRWFHNLAGAVVVTGVWIAWLGLCAAVDDSLKALPAEPRGTVRYGMVVVAVGAALALATDAWYFTTLPTGGTDGMPDVRTMLTSLDFDGWRSALWWAAWPAAAAAGLSAAWAAATGRLSGPILALITGLVVVSRCGDVVGRSVIREAALSPYLKPEMDFVEQTQWTAMAAFAVTAVAGVLTIAWMLRLLWRMRSPGRPI